jgi:hypothetical protein
LIPRCDPIAVILAFGHFKPKLSPKLNAARVA